ncbi:hypothetical protein TNCT_642241 [Trichonephila clavata]|uniref:Uncharacterized protein n=1 Tax=Trichonephila clavata TaxID=2740835 RepID=A0A8X6H669_TRICU|nr:hypothetical protein TNCT_642241 [Trichonephila clavata]
MEKALSQAKFITAIITSRDTMLLFTFCLHQSQIQLNCLCVNINMPPGTCTINMDMQQVIFTPTLTQPPAVQLQPLHSQWGYQHELHVLVA